MTGANECTAVADVGTYLPMVAFPVFRLLRGAIYLVKLRTLHRRVRVGYSIQRLGFEICTPDLALLGCSKRAWHGVERVGGGDCE